MPDFCYRCQKVTETRAVQQGSRMSYRCASCDWEVDCDYDDDYPDECDEEEDEFEEAVQECGLLPPHLGGGCQLAGTEHCDFECPFRDNPELITGGDGDEV